jgi:XTP/dITP diphosphohydrolase
MREIVLATRNQGKLREMAEIARPYGITVLPLPDAVEMPPETGRSFLENARLKARHGHRVTGLPVLADDSGIEVDALGGAPGIYSARFSGEGATDARNNELLLRRLGSETRRGARYRAALVLCDGEREWSAIGTWEGEILSSPRGTGGFGYDPLFFVPELGRSAAELSPAEKSRHSHRGKAMRTICALLAGQLAEGEVD